MKRVLMSVAVALLTSVGLFIPMFGFSSSSSVASDPVVIDDYNATYDVGRDGDMKAVETLTTSFPSGRHGIFRFWDSRDTTDRGVRYRPENIEVTLDGRSVPFKLSWENHSRYRVAKIGDPDSTVSPGQHVYKISYTVQGVLAADSSSPGYNSSSWGSGDHARFTWRVVPDGFQMKILRSQATINLPVAPTSFACATTNSSECTVTAPDATTRVVTTGQLPPSNGVAVRADMPFVAPSRSTLPWPVEFDAVFGRSVPVLVAMLVLSLVTFAIGLMWALRSRESAPLLPVMYSPPDDPQNPGRVLGPVQTYYVAYEHVPTKALTATLFHLAETRAVTLSRNGSDWTVTSQVTPEMLARMDPCDRALVDALGLTSAGSTFAADGSVESGRKLKDATSKLDTAARVWGSSSGTVTSATGEQLGRFTVGSAAIAAGVLFIFQWLPASIWVLPIAAFAIGGAGLFSSGVGTRRTLLGRDVWSRAGGFERLLSTRSNQERLDFSARKELFTSYIPYAMAFNCADAWADKYRYATGHEPPDPVWFGPGFYHGGATGFYGSNAFDSFESSLSSSLSAYSASQSSSSSGGGFSGGGFGGGGGGGGGGGSW
ncbi:MAG: DUF2207 domain-containing protein [Gordonia sp. (in: high G+C Gram-positive bacteria)]